MASGTGSWIRAAGGDMAERQRQRVLACRRGEFKVPCTFDHTKPETLPPQPQGHFVDLFEAGRVYYPTLEEQWPEIPPALAPCNLERFKAELVRPGRRFRMTPGHCDCYTIFNVHRLQLSAALHIWRNTASLAEFKEIPDEELRKYI